MSDKKPQTEKNSLLLSINARSGAQQLQLHIKGSQDCFDTMEVVLCTLANDLNRE